MRKNDLFICSTILVIILFRITPMSLLYAIENNYALLKKKVPSTNQTYI